MKLTIGSQAGLIVAWDASNSKPLKVFKSGGDRVRRRIENGQVRGLLDA
jgi:hypothetical protein